VDESDAVGNPIGSGSSGEEPFESLFSVGIGKGFDLDSHGVVSIGEDDRLPRDISVNARSDKKTKGLRR
jgi:hypothetical protein